MKTTEQENTATTEQLVHNEQKAANETAGADKTTQESAAAEAALEAELRRALKAKTKKKFPIKPVVIILVIAVIAVVGLLWLRRRAATPSQSSLTDYTVVKGDVSVSISGTAAVEPREQYTIQSLVTGEILEDFLEEGQELTKDQLLYTVDTKNVDSNILRSEISLERQRISYNKTLDNIGSMSVTASTGGLVTQVYVKNGDSIMNGAKIADVVDNTRMSMVVPFLSDDAARISKGMKALVVISESGIEINGTVERVYTGRRAGDDGAQVTDVEITISNPGGMKEGDSATAIVADSYACNGAGTMSYAESYTITSDGAGDLHGFGLKAGDQVKQGQVVGTLTNESNASDLRSAELSLQDAEIQLQNLKDSLEDYSIRAPINGKVIEKTAKLGDKLDSATARANMAVVADMSELVFTLNVDELDIAKVELGQTAIVTCDAVEGKVFEAIVENISVIGRTSNGVTSYPVKMAIKDYEGLWPGMNINAEIVVAEARDVLIVPSSAVQRGNMVLRKTNGATGQRNENAPGADRGGNEMPALNQASGGRQSGGGAAQGGRTGMMGQLEAPEGYEYVRVTLGLSNSDFVEIKDGLNEGDIIGYTRVELSTNINDFMGMGGMSGGGNVTFAQPGGGAQRTATRIGG